ncbi:hypothetical protein CHLNCDRAFT_141386 [Chlorella variabilis]|uniref:Glycosyltransferase family 92 protein n=1 Tax=Chlorella variabilis TaxID=554065 RepID=E1ZSS4_CHLVA|nr:hypothetical protein CHLNCDRAFT_141386 [Chlorella variabilis]EFN51160.1 hypothetical protein CHLNCDRAFT_141386 [Chlorella variabilis]|eukprot:XP_005843262.1 hypothetical protein CHLNCDRAFT_141386 [Chlorella variabilis]
MRPVLEDLIGEGLVKYHYITNKSLPGYPHLDVAPGHSLNWQTPVFRTCLHHYGAQHRWMAFIDAGEFIVLKDGVSSLPDLLKRHESHPGLVLHWRFFSFNGHIDRPRQGVSFDQAVLQHYGTKSLFDFSLKMKRRGGAGGQKTLEYFLQWHRACNESCTEAVPLGQQLAERYDLTKGISYREAMLYHSCAERCTEAVPLGRQQG